MRRGQLLLTAAVLCLTMILVTSPSALASRPAYVDIQNTPVYEGPGKGFKLLEKLPKGSPVAASNVPIEGFFKVRTSTGIVGFVSADSLVLQGDGASTGDPVLSTTAPSSTPVETTPVTGFRGKKQHPVLILRAMGGVNFFSASDINAFLGFNALKLGIGYGASLELFVTKDVAMIIRFEKIGKSLVSKDSTTLQVFQLDYVSTPVMMGASVALADSKTFTTSLSLMGGLAIGTQLISTTLTSASPNETIWSSNPWTVMGAVNVDWRISGPLSFFLDVGYRVLQTSSITPGTTGNGSEIYQTGGEFTGVRLDMNGPVANLGLAISF